MRTTVRKGLDLYEIVDRRESGSGDRVEFPTLDDARFFLESFGRDLVVWNTMRSVGLRPTAHVRDRWDARDAATSLLLRLIEGDLKVYHRRERLIVRAVDVPDDDHSGGEEEIKTWIELELVDQDGNPVGGQRYRITLPDGRTREGRLNSSGFAREDGIERGMCTVEFLDLDRDAVEPA